jgi:TrwC relaxase
VLFKATVAASETYNTALEHHLHDRLGVRLADGPDADPGKRPIRETVGVDPVLNQRWSTRRVLIKDRKVSWRPGVRAVQVPTDKVDQLVELLVDEVLHTRSVGLTRTDDGISEPAALRRADGSSVYTVAGSDRRGSR